jgi:hypothetical protein
MRQHLARQGIPELNLPPNILMIYLPQTFPYSPKSSSSQKREDLNTRRTLNKYKNGIAGFTYRRAPKVLQ